MSDFDEFTIQKVWEKGNIASVNDHSKWRKDKCTAWISRSEYGNRDSAYGWEIHHVNPNGSDVLSNLIPLHWVNNVSTSDDGGLSCPVRSEGSKNVRVVPARF